MLDLNNRLFFKALKDRGKPPIYDGEGENEVRDQFRVEDYYGHVDVSEIGAIRACSGACQTRGVSRTLEAMA